MYPRDLRLGLVSLVAIIGCKSGTDRAAPAGGSQQAPPAEAAVDSPAGRARAVVGQFKASLKQALTVALGERGPGGAIEVCATEAPRLAAAVSKGPIQIGRATRRPRNPANAATGWQADAIAYFEAMPAGDRAKATFTKLLPDGATAYAEPLIVGGLCLVCHGQALSSEVTAALAARYPEDRATGYAEGDLRGVAWAEVR